MSTLFMTKGLPASGKSTWAKNKVNSVKNTKRVNKDELRAMLDCGKWSKQNEKFVLEVRNSIVHDALKSKCDIIVDDTNLDAKHEQELRDIAAVYKAQFSVMDFTDISLEVCLERDKNRPNYVGEKVILGMYNRYLAAPVPTIPYNTNKPYCIIVDIDGTVAHKNGRNAYDMAKVSEDTPNGPVIETVCSMRDNAHTFLVFVSGRDESCRKDTLIWLERYLCEQNAKLYMRSQGDCRDDRIVKKELYETFIKPKYNVVCVFDDRNKVVRMWRELGLPCFQVAEGDF